MRVLLDSDPFTTPPPDEHTFIRMLAPGRWPASWIDVERAAPRAPVVSAFVLRLALSSPLKTRIHVSADERYVLYLDGVRIGRGPERGCLEAWSYETHDLALQAGEHAIIAHTWWLGPDRRPVAQISARPAFLLAAEGPPPELMNTGRAAWECKRLAGYDWISRDMAWGTGDRVRICGAELPWGFHQGWGDGWRRAETIVQAASAAHVADGGHVWWLRPAMLPPMRDRPVPAGRVRHLSAIGDFDGFDPVVRACDHIESEVEIYNRLLGGTAPLTVAPRTLRRAIIDLYEYRTAYVELMTTGGAGSRVRVRWAESLFGPGDDKGNRDQIEGKRFVGVGNVFEPDGGAGRPFEGFWWEAGRYLELTIATADEPLALEHLVLRETGYPYEIHGWFESSTPALEEVAAIGLRALEACSHETYMDCPYYEQLQYVGDTRLEVLATYALTRDDRLPRKAITMFDLSREATGLTRSRYPDGTRQIIPPFSLLWVAMVHDWAMYRGDLAFLRERMRGVRGVIDFFVDALDEGHLLVSPRGWNFFDWVGGADTGWDFGTPPAAEAGGRSGIYQFQLAYVMRLAAELEHVVGEPELSARARRIAASLCEAGHGAFWDDQRGLYADDPGKRFTSEHAQCFALLAGAVPQEHVDRVRHALLSVPLARATIYFTHYLFEAYRLLGETDALFDRLGLWFSLRSQGLRTTPETPEPTRSDCHAWGAHPIHHFVATILGVRPSSLGFAAFTMEPRLGPLTWARAAVPHPNGEIYAEVRRAGTELHGLVRVPEGVRGTLVLGARGVDLGPGENTF